MVWWYVSMPTSSRSLCFPLTRRHFWESATRRALGAAFPRMMSLNWFIPALVNMSVGSSLITIGADGTILWPLEAKKSLKDSRISLAVSIF